MTNCTIVSICNQDLVTMSVAERKEREKEQRRNDIISAAEQLFFTRQFDDVSMDDIAKSIELSRATLYLYFQDKESLYFAVMLRGIRIMSEKFKESADGETTGLGKINAIGNMFIRFSSEYSEYNRLLHYATSQRFEACKNEYVNEVKVASAELIGIMCSSIKKGIDDGTIKNDLDPYETAIFLMNCTENALDLSPEMKRKLEERGISPIEYIEHSMKLMGYAILNNTNNRV
jgi:TetR/AcrR family transcriptional regulator